MPERVSPGHLPFLELVAPSVARPLSYASQLLRKYRYLSSFLIFLSRRCKSKELAADTAIPTSLKKLPSLRSGNHYGIEELFSGRFFYMRTNRTLNEFFVTVSTFVESANCYSISNFARPKLQIWLSLR
jgi:hypothetical protein